MRKCISRGSEFSASGVHEPRGDSRLGCPAERSSAESEHKRALGQGRLPLFANDCRNFFLVLLGYSFLSTRTSPTRKTQPKELDMAKNHYSTKPKRRNRSGKRKDTRRIAANMAKIKELERSSAPTK